MRRNFYLSLQMYAFSQDDLSRVVNKPSFRTCVALAVYDCNVPANRRKFVGELDYNNLPALPLLSCYDDPNNAVGKPWYSATLRDYEDLMRIILRAQDQFCIEYWCYLGQCPAQAVLITYPMCKLLWPEKSFDIVYDQNHVAVSDGEFIYDPIAQSLGENIFRGKLEYVPEANILPWYTSRYSYVGMDLKKYSDAFKSLTQDFL